MAKPASLLKSLLVGRPKETAGLAHERLTKTVGLAVFASDNLSSAAYATEEMLAVLVLGGAAALHYSIPISLALVAVVGIIALSYRETIHAYPSGGGAYIVAHDNLGKFPGLVAAAALLIDYVLTVSVSVAAGVASIITFAPGLHNYRVLFALGVIWLITIMNLRGIRESGRIFAVPTYAFIFLVGATIVYGIIRYFAFGARPAMHGFPAATHPVTIFLLLTAFARGSAAVTGIEAISNGIPAFREPAAKNASTTLIAMASILAFLFLGISVLSHLFHVFAPTPTRTVVGLIALQVYGKGPMFIAVLGATALILFLAANTSYADFPRLSAVLARDRFMPRQFMNRGDRLAFSNGIVGVAVFASILIVIFQAEVSRLINLYVMGVFTALTLSQTGMLRHWRRVRDQEPKWRRYSVMNGIGAVVTFVVLVIVLWTRFTHGGWMVVCAIPVFVYAMNRVSSHYEEVGRQLRDPTRAPPPARDNHVILLVGTPSQEERRAFAYAQRIQTDDFRCVHFAERGDPKGLEPMWVRELGLLPTSPALEIVKSDTILPRALRGYIDRFRARIPPEDFVTVIVSERVKEGPLLTLGTRRALVIKTTLLFTPGVVTTDVPYVDGVRQTALDPMRVVRHVVVVCVPAAHNATLHALQYAKTLSADEIRIVHVELDPEMSKKHVREWEALSPGYPLEVIGSPYRRLGAPIRDYVRQFTADGDTIVTVILAEFIVTKWWQHLLHNGNGYDIKWTLLPEPDVVVTLVPYRLEQQERGRVPAR
jgi:amino acid transporter